MCQDAHITALVKKLCTLLYEDWPALCESCNNLCDAASF